MDFLSNEKNKKYGYLANLLTKLEDSSEYKGILIDETRTDLIMQRDDDKKQLLEIISDELKKDGITKIIINNQALKTIDDSKDED